MSEVNEPKPMKKGKSRPSFSAPVYATEARASGWVDISPGITLEPVEEVITETTPMVIAEQAPPPPARSTKLAIRPRTRVAIPQEPIEIERERPAAAAPTVRQTPNHSLLVAGISMTISIVAVSAWVAMEMFSLPMRVAAGILDSRNKR